MGELDNLTYFLWNRLAGSIRWFAFGMHFTTSTNCVHNLSSRCKETTPQPPLLEFICAGSTEIAYARQQNDFAKRTRTKTSGDHLH